MRSFCSLEEEEEEDRFFDTREDITSVSDSSSDCPDNVELGSSLRIVDLVSSSVRYDLWMKNPDSVNERRSNFFKWLGMSSDEAMKGDSGEQSGIEFSVEIGRTREDSGAVLANSDCEVTFSSSRPSMSCYSSDTLDSSERGGSEANFVCRIKNLDDGTEFVVDRLGHDGMLSRLREVGSNRLLSVEEFQNTLGLSPLVKQFMCREADAGKTNSMETTKRAKRGWLKRLGAAACIVDMEDGGGSLRLTPSGVGTVAKVQRVRVHSSKKRSKELSALYTGQEIQAHKGTIRTMRFSPDGCYLATAGEDRSVRVWQVMESERSNDIDIPDIDPSRLYFRANQYSELAPISSEKEKSYKVKNLRRTSDSSCVIFPPRVFRLSEKPLHEFYGHSGEILDLSWSNHMHLLSSSVNKTVRLWRVGYDQCLRVFSHNNYVTCIQFNPVDDNYFISGSIDGKVRIWDVPGCRVVDWTDVKEIVTALCYRPDGKGAIVGSVGGNCRFYNVTREGVIGAITISDTLRHDARSTLDSACGFRITANWPTRSKSIKATFPSEELFSETEKSPYQYRGMFHALSTVLREEGPRALYKGWLPSVIGVEAELAKEKSHGYKLGKEYIAVNLLDDFDRFMKVPDEWDPPETKTCTPGENLQQWLTNKERDHFVIRAISDTEVLWHEACYVIHDYWRKRV